MHCESAKSDSSSEQSSHTSGPDSLSSESPDEEELNIGEGIDPCSPQLTPQLLGDCSRSSSVKVLSDDSESLLMGVLVLLGAYLGQ